MEKKTFMKYFKNVVMFIMSDNVVVLYNYLFFTLKRIFERVKRLEVICEDVSLWI